MDVALGATDTVGFFDELDGLGQINEAFGSCMILGLLACRISGGTKPISSEAPLMMRRSAWRNLPMNDGRGTTKCGSSSPLASV